MSVTGGSLSPPLTQEKHCLFVLFQHGHWGTMDKFKYLHEVISRELRTECKFNQAEGSGPTKAFSCSSPFASASQDSGSSTTTADVLHDVSLWGSDVNSLIYSESGTVKCGKRLTDALAPVLENWVLSQSSDLRNTSGASSSAPPAVATSTMVTTVGQDTSPVNRRVKFYFSCVGHSFGGVILRETLHHLISGSSSGIIKKANIELVSYVSLASPHCGVTDMPGAFGGGLMTTAMSWGGTLLGKTLSSTVNDLFLGNDVLSSSHLFSPQYLTSLDRFRHKRLYGNMVGDPAVSFHTSTGLPLAAPLQEEKTSSSQGQTTTVIPVEVVSAARDYPHVLPPFHTKNRAPPTTASVASGGPSDAESVEGGTHPIYEVHSAGKWKEQGYPSEICVAAAACAKRKENLTIPPSQYTLGKTLLATLNNVTVHPVVHHSQPSTWTVQYMTHIRVHDCILGMHCPPLPPQASSPLPVDNRASDLTSQTELVEREENDDLDEDEEMKAAHAIATSSSAAPPKTLQEVAGTGMPDVAVHIAKHLLSDWAGCIIVRDDMI